MTLTNNFEFEADMATKTIRLSREFNAPVGKVWRAFTEPELAEKWMAPKPWRIETKEVDLTVGGVWKYIMAGPEGQQHWVYDEYTAIEKESLLSSIGMFCDDEGNPNRDGSKSYQDIRFSSIDGNRTKVAVQIVLESEDTLNWFMQGGFKEGTAMTYDQLDEILASV